MKYNTMMYKALLTVDLPKNLRPVLDGQGRAMIRRLEPGEIGWDFSLARVQDWGGEAEPSHGFYLVVEEVPALPAFPKELGPSICGITMDPCQNWVGYVNPPHVRGCRWEHTGQSFLIQTPVYSLLPNRLPDIDPKHWKETWIPNPNWQGNR